MGEGTFFRCLRKVPPAHVLALALWLSLRWRLCRHCLTLPSLSHWCCRCWGGTVNVVALVSLPSLHRRCCCGCAGVLVLIVLASLPSLQWCCHPCCAGVFAIVFAVFGMVLPTLLRWHPLCYHCAGITAVVAIVLLPFLPDVVTLVLLVSLMTRWKSTPSCG